MLKKVHYFLFSACYYFSCVLYSRFVDRKEDGKEKQDVTEKSWKHRRKSAKVTRRSEKKRRFLKQMMSEGKERSKEA